MAPGALRRNYADTSSIGPIGLWLQVVRSWQSDFCGYISSVSELNKAIPTALPKFAELRRLGKNLNGYLGETIDIEAVLSDCIIAARTHGWTVEEILAKPNLSLIAFR